MGCNFNSSHHVNSATDKARQGMTHDGTIGDNCSTLSSTVRVRGCRREDAQREFKTVSTRRRRDAEHRTVLKTQAEHSKQSRSADSLAPLERSHASLRPRVSAPSRLCVNNSSPISDRRKASFPRTAPSEFLANPATWMVYNHPTNPASWSKATPSPH
ncbi:hypothetical protein RISK_003032 [Rhodopirellula islandica]|uniref:Uncharacterized protein n=1 Tax=Rhodopirellula islandica TaxID=595434 RepID=A0A0J1EGU5_RHOIS|nr:hypothetical protein RISK_003032 [Rhodopirellula islandica]